MTDMLRTFLEISVTGAVMICLVWAFRAIFSKRINPIIIAALWIAVLLRLCVPFTIESPIHAGDLVEIPQIVAAEPLPSISMSVIDPGPDLPSEVAVESSVDMYPGTVSGGKEGSEAVQVTEPTLIEGMGELLRGFSIWNMLAAIWIAGAAGVLLWTLWQALLFKRKIQKGREITDPAMLDAVDSYKKQLGIRRAIRVWQCGCVNTPAIFRYVRPYLLLPEDFAREAKGERLGHVLLHELCHIRRQDILLGYLWLLAKALHWYNPLVWAAYRLFRDDAELCCDQMVLKHLKGGDPYAYSQTLIDVVRSSKRNAVTAAMSLCENKVRLKERVVRMLNPEKRSRFAVAVSLLLGIVMLIGCFTTACRGGSGAVLGPSGEKIVYADGYVAGQDSQYWYTGELYNYTPMADTENGYYFMGGPLNAFLYYMDKITGESFPVCNKPGCEHRYDPYLAIRENEKCNAYAGDHRIRALMMYGDTLYALGYVGYDGSYSDTLYELSTDGDAPKELRQLTAGGHVDSITIHRGYVYYMVASYGDPLSDDSTYMYQLYRLPVEDIGTEPKLIFSREEKKAYCGRLLCYGNYLYFEEFYRSDNESVNYINRYDIRTGKIKTILDGKWGWHYTIFNGKLVYTLEDGTYLCDLDGKHARRISEERGIVSFCRDYLIIDIARLERDFSVSPRMVYAYDSAGNFAGEIILEDWESYPDPVGVVDDKYIMPRFDENTDTHSIYYMPVEKIADGTAVPEVFYKYVPDE